MKSFLSKLFIILLVLVSGSEYLLVKAQDIVNQKDLEKIELWSFQKNQATFKYKEPSALAVEEWKNSAIHDDLIKLNLVSLPSYVNIANGDIVSYPTLDLIGAEYSNLLKNDHELDYYPIESSWTYLGYDPFTFKESKYFEIKSHPVLREGFKYENSVDKRFVKLPKISYRVASRIFPDLYFLKYIKDPSLEAKDFWLNVSKSNIDIFFTEGFKKSLSLLSHGIVSIGIKGSCRGFDPTQGVGPSDIRLSEEVRTVLSWKPRRFFVSFDTDPNDKLRETVRIYTYNFAKYIDQSMKSQSVKIVDITEGDLKAADDLIFKYGFDHYKALVDNAMTLPEYYLKYKPMSANEYFTKVKGAFRWCFHRCDGKDCVEKFLKKKNEKVTPSEMVDYKFSNVVTKVFKYPQQTAVKEWKKSAISQDIIDLNLISVPDIILDDNGNFSTYPLADIMSLNPLKFVEAYGISKTKSQRNIWTYSGYEVNRDFEESDSFEFKLSKPIRTNDKYEHSLAHNRIIFPKVSYRIAKKIFPQRYSKIASSIANQEATEFWKQVFNSKKIIYLTEGHKKALSLLSQGLIAVSVTQSCLGIRVVEGEEIKLIEDLEEILKRKKRKFVLVYDHDENQRIRQFVASAVSFVATEIENRGHDVAMLRMPDAQIKAIDDYLYQKGFVAFKENILDKEYSLDYYNENFVTKSLDDYYQDYLRGNKEFSFCLESCEGKCMGKTFKKKN